MLDIPRYMDEVFVEVFAYRHYVGHDSAVVGDEPNTCYPFHIRKSGKHLGHRKEAPGQQKIFVVEGGHYVPGRLGECVVYNGPGGCVVVGRQLLYVGEFVFVSLDNLPAMVGGVVVYDDELEVGVVLGEYRLDGLGYILFSIEAGRNNGYFWVLFLSHRGRCVEAIIGLYL